MSKKNNKILKIIIIISILLIIGTVVTSNRIIKEDMKAFPPCTCVTDQNGNKKWGCVGNEQYATHPAPAECPESLY